MRGAGRWWGQRLALEPGGAEGKEPEFPAGPRRQEAGRAAAL